MATTAKELKEWLETIGDEKMVAIDEGGLALIVKGERSYYEIGGIPEEDDFTPGSGWEYHV